MQNNSLECLVLVFLNVGIIFPSCHCKCDVFDPVTFVCQNEQLGDINWDFLGKQ